MEKTSAENMQDLLDLSEKEITDAYTAFDDEGFSINDICVMPLRDRGFIHENPYEALRNGASKDIPVIIGTNKDEWRYWATVMIDTDHFKKSEEEMAEDISIATQQILSWSGDTMGFCDSGMQPEGFGICPQGMDEGMIEKGDIWGTLGWIYSAGISGMERYLKVIT